MLEKTKYELDLLLKQCEDDNEAIEMQKEIIDNMTHLEMCSIWRFAKSGNVYTTNGEIGDYFQNRLFKHFGGFTTEISKELGLEL